MSTSPGSGVRAASTPTGTGAGDRVPLRLALRDRTAATRRLDGAWWPQSHDLRTEAADLVDHFPASAGRINRLLFSRPNWDDGVVDGRGLRRIQAARGPVKVGSFPGDDTNLMVLSMASCARLRLLVIASETGGDEARRLLLESSAASPEGPDDASDPNRRS